MTYELIDSDGERLAKLMFDPFRIQPTDVGSERDVSATFGESDQMEIIEGGEPPQGEEGDLPGELWVSPGTDELKDILGSLAMQKGMVIRKANFPSEPRKGSDL